MDLTFLAPTFLFGLAALSIPILIHLTYRQKATIVQFPSLMFLQRVPFRSMRRQKIRHWLLFLLRCFALILLATAFARPFIDREGVSAVLSSSAREVVILVDRSYSMDYGDRWEDARVAARDAVAGLDAGDRASVVFFSEGAQLAVRPTAETTVLRGAIDAANAGTGTTRYAPAVKLAEQLLLESDLPRREVFLISDLQKVGWDPQDDLRLPEGTDVQIVDLSGAEASNLSVAGIVLQREFAERDESVSVAARLTNQGETAFEDLEVILEINGESVQNRRASLGPNSAATVAFDPVVVDDRELRCTVRAGDDALPLDNAFHFVVTPGEAFPVLILENPGASDTDSLYLRRALQIGSRPSFRVDVMGVDDVGAADLEDRVLVILNDAPFPSGAAGRQLRQMLEDGIGLVVALGELSEADGWGDGPAAAVLPVFGEPVDRSSDLGGTLASFDANHPIFEVFKAPRSGDFTSANFYRYRPLTLTENDRTLAGFDDGAATLVERSVGTGRVLVWTTTFDRFWNNFALQPVFLPFAHQLAKHAAAYNDAEPWHTVGQAIDPSAFAAVGIPQGTDIAVVSGSGTESTYTIGEASGGLRLSEQGFFELSWSTDDGEQRATLAANLDRSESDLTSIDAEEFAAATSHRAGEPGALSSDTQVTAEDRESSQGFWWYLLVGAFLLLASETLLSNRLSPSRATQRGV